MKQTSSHATHTAYQTGEARVKHSKMYCYQLVGGGGNSKCVRVTVGEGEPSTAITTGRGGCPEWCCGTSLVMT